MKMTGHSVNLDIFASNTVLQDINLSGVRKMKILMCVFRLVASYFLTVLVCDNILTFMVI